MHDVKEIAISKQVITWSVTAYALLSPILILSQRAYTNTVSFFNVNHYFPFIPEGIILSIAIAYGIFLAVYLAKNTKINSDKEFMSKIARRIFMATLLSTAIVNPCLIFFGIFPYLLTLWAPFNRLLLNSKYEWLFEAITDAKSIKYVCLMVILASVTQVTILTSYYHISFSHLVAFLPIATIPLIIAISKVTKNRLLQTKESNRNRILWHRTTFYLFSGSLLTAIFAIFFVPQGLGDWIVGWLMASTRDANILLTNPVHKPLILDFKSLGYPYTPISKKDNFEFFMDFALFVKSLFVLFTSFVLMPLIVRTSSLLTSLSSRINTSSFIDIIRQVTTVLQMPYRAISIKESMPLLHNFSASLLWYLFCYFVLFYVFGFMQGPVGASITNWINFSIRDAGFKLDIWNLPELRVFIGALIALMGAVPVAITGCVFLPPFKPKQILLNNEGIVLTRGPYLSTFFSPVREWIDIKEVCLKNTNQKRKKQTLKISFLSGGTISLKLNQLSNEDILLFISSLDENAPNCSIDKSVLELKNELVSNDLPEAGEFRELSSKNFKSTIFSPFQVGHVIQGKEIRIVRQLSTKQLSAVYLVRTQSGKLAILKQFFVPDSSPSTEKIRKLFLRECELLRTLEHERIANVHETFELEESSFLLLEHASGEDLTKQVKANGPLSEKQILEIALQLSEILSYLHEREPSVLHRDITPDNIVMDNDGQIHLIDFGAAHQFLEGITGTLIGKQCYVAPEQLRGHPSTKSDIYSFGCTLNFLLTSNDPKALSQSDPALCTRVSKGLRDLIMNCTEFEESSRPNSFREIKKSIQLLLFGSTPLDEQIIEIAKENIEHNHKIDLSQKEAIIDG